MLQGKPVGTPDSGAFFRVIEEHNVCSLFTAPTAIRMIRTEVGFQFLYLHAQQMYC
jgi:propionyl-CoA synthetase